MSNKEQDLDDILNDALDAIDGDDDDEYGQQSQSLKDAARDAANLSHAGASK